MSEFQNLRRTFPLEKPPSVWQARGILPYATHKLLCRKALMKAFRTLGQHSLRLRGALATGRMQFGGRAARQVCASGRGVGSHVAICVCRNTVNHARNPAENTARTKPANARLLA